MKLIHTADWQLGKPFAGVRDPHMRSLLQEARIKAISRIGDVAREHRAEMVLVAGDLFDSPTVTRATVSAACSAIGGIGLPVIAIPGNHDFGGVGSIWEQPYFENERRALAPNLRVALSSEPIEVGGAVIFPCPLLRRHEAHDPTSWLRTPDTEFARFGSKPRIVLAHGSVQGFGSEGDDEDSEPGTPNLIDLSRLRLDSFDYIALGDWHGAKEISEKAWYSGTPEPDRFPKGNNPGHVLVVAADRGAVPKVEIVETAAIGWHEIGFSFSEGSDLGTLREMMDRVVSNRVHTDLVRLRISGSVGMSEAAELERAIETWESRLIRLKVSNDSTIAPTEEESLSLANSVGNPLISKVAARLVALIERNGDDANAARVALRELYALTREVAR